MKRAPQIYLASSSPRRRELLDQLGVYYEQLSAPVDETRRPAEAPAVYVSRMALEKARAGHARASDKGRPVLGADTAVAAGEAVLGKPRDRAEGMAMLARLSGVTHHVYTAVAVVDAEREASRLSVSAVCLRTLSEEERAWYWDSGEPADKAGGYAVQGRGAQFIARLEGSYSGVMGLPLFETAELLREFGVDVLRGQA